MKKPFRIFRKELTERQQSERDSQGTKFQFSLPAQTALEAAYSQFTNLRLEVQIFKKREELPKDILGAILYNPPAGIGSISGLSSKKRNVDKAHGQDK